MRLQLSLQCTILLDHFLNSRLKHHHHLIKNLPFFAQSFDLGYFGRGNLTKRQQLSEELLRMWWIFWASVGCLILEKLGPKWLEALFYHTYPITIINQSSSRNGQESKRTHVWPEKGEDAQHISCLQGRLQFRSDLEVFIKGGNRTAINQGGTAESSCWRPGECRQDWRWKLLLVLSQQGSASGKGLHIVVNRSREWNTGKDLKA